MEYNSFTRLEIVFGLGFGLDEGDCGGEGRVWWGGWELEWGGW